MTKKAKNFAIISLASLLTLFVSCGQTKASSTSETTETKVEASSVTADETTKAETTAIKKGGVFKIANGTEPESLDPHLMRGEPEHRISLALFEGLVTNDPKTAKAIPGVAESWDVSEDGTQYTFHLRKCNWSDGTPITADDVLYSWLRSLDPQTANPYAWFPAMFIKGANDFSTGEGKASDVGIRVLDESTFQVDLVGPLPYAIDAMAHYSFAIVPKHVIEEFGDKWTNVDNIVCNGPFVLNEHVPQSYISCTKNENYWDKDNVSLDEVIYYASEDANTNYNMYIAGELDWNPSTSTEQMGAAKMRNDFQPGPQLATAYYIFHCQKAPFDNPKVRAAFSYAVDRDGMVENILQAGQLPCWGMVPPMEGYDALEFPFDDYEDATEKAQELLAEAGYPNGTGFPEVEILYNVNESNRKVAEALQQTWKEVLNVNCKLDNKEWGTFLSTRDSGQFQLARSGWTGDYQDPNTFLDMFVTGAGMNAGDYSNPEYDALIKKAANMKAGAERFAVLKQAEEILINEDHAIVPFYFYASSNMIDTTKWGGWYNNTINYHPVKDIYIK